MTHTLSLWFMTSAHHADSDSDATMLRLLPRGRIACVVRYYDAAPTHRHAIIARLITIARSRRIQLFVSVMHGHRLPIGIKTIHVSSWYKARYGVSSWRRAHHTATTSSTSIHSVAEWTRALQYNPTYCLISPIYDTGNKKALPRATRAAILASSHRHHTSPRLLALGGITQRTPIDKRFHGRAMRRGFTSPRNAPITKPS